MNYSFHNRVVWITGASKGIGLSLANELHQLGAQLILSARDSSKIKGIPSATLLDCDVTDKAQVAQVVATIVEKFGGLDCIILNAGNAEYVDVAKFDADIYRRMMEVNFMSQVEAVEICLPHLRKSPAPYIVGMTSSVAWLGLSRGHAYSASKAAARNFFQGLSLDLVNDDIPVSIICPGFVKTPLTDKNDFPMPGLITAESAGQRIANGLVKMKPEIHFPKRFTWPLKYISCLPAGIRFWLLKKVV
ncbi:MAG: SDR family NAD(P)-dependent oxidoreductase [Gammaproteobacteria bacterium]|nr:SDR family NAD(P)-dependent oxidoreductase [Gammaproteobacteria bacterium]NNJ72003.1 SDR family NAD(P)-dependent oxidoreductase [Enterobacterales bacterium]